MPRAIWTGSLSFGLVNVPVGLFSATDDKAIHFNQFQAGTPDRIRQKRVNERTGDEVEYADVVKGYDLGGGEYVIVTPEELESVEPGRSRTIEITDFVDLDAIDPIYYKSTYYLGPRVTRPPGPMRCCARPWRRATRWRWRLSCCARRSTSSRSGPPSRCWPSRPCTSPTRSAIR